MQWRGAEETEVLARLMSDRYFQYYMKKLDTELDRAVQASLSQQCLDRGYAAGYAAALQSLRQSLKPPSGA